MLDVPGHPSPGSAGGLSAQTRMRAGRLRSRGLYPGGEQRLLGAAAARLQRVAACGEAALRKAHAGAHPALFIVPLKPETATEILVY